MGDSAYPQRWYTPAEKPVPGFETETQGAGHIDTPVTVTDKASYDELMAQRVEAIYKESTSTPFALQYDKHWLPATQPYRCNFVSSIDPSRKYIRQQSLGFDDKTTGRIDDPAQSSYKREASRQARQLARDRALIVEPQSTGPAFAGGGWQEKMVAELTMKHSAVDREMRAGRDAMLSELQRDRTNCFEQHRAALQKEDELVRPHLQPALALHDIGEYQRSGMLADNPHMHCADSAIAWKQQTASREADLRAASQFHSALSNRQKYLDAGMFHLTKGLV